MPAASPYPQSSLIVACGQPEAAKKLYEKLQVAATGAPAIGLVSLSAASPGEVRIVTRTEEGRRERALSEQDAFEAVSHELTAVLGVLRRRSAGPQIEPGPNRSAAMDVVVLVAPTDMGLRFAVKALRALSQLTPIARTSGVRLTVLAPAREAATIPELRDCAARLASDLDVAAVPRGEHRLLLLDAYDRRCRCLDPAAWPAFLAELMTAITSPAIRAGLMRFAKQPDASWSEAAMSAGFLTLPLDARPLMRSLLAEVRRTLSDAMFEKRPLPAVAPRDKTVAALATWVGTAIEGQELPAGSLGQVAELARQEMLVQEAHLQALSGQECLTVDPDRLGFQPVPQPRSAGRLRRMMSWLWPLPAAIEDPWTGDRRRTKQVLAAREDAQQELDRACDVYNALRSVQESLHEAPSDDCAAFLPRRLCRWLLARCGLTTNALTQQAARHLQQNETLGNASTAACVIQELEQWALEKLGIAPSAPLLAAMQSLAIRARTSVQGLLDGLVQGMRAAAAPFYCGPFDPERYQSQWLAAHPVGAEVLLGLLVDGGAPVEAVVGNGQTLVAVELLDGVDLGPHVNRIHAPHGAVLLPPDARSTNDAVHLGAK
jgi:hypothetical protein